MIKNPCKQCLVKTMCKETCDPFTQYVETNIRRPLGTAVVYNLVAQHIKEGRYEIVMMPDDTITIRVRHPGLGYGSYESL